MKKNNDWLILKMEGRSNPILIRKDAVAYLIPNWTNELKTVLWLKGQDKAMDIDQPTSSIEEQL